METKDIVSTNIVCEQTHSSKPMRSPPNAFARKALLVIKCVANTLQFLSHCKNEVVSMKSNVESNWFHFLKGTFIN